MFPGGRLEKVVDSGKSMLVKAVWTVTSQAVRAGQSYRWSQWQGSRKGEHYREQDNITAISFSIAGYEIVHQTERPLLVVCTRRGRHMSVLSWPSWLTLGSGSDARDRSPSIRRRAAKLRLVPVHLLFPAQNRG